jgi:hypothetical protein
MTYHCKDLVKYISIIPRQLSIQKKKKLTKWARRRMRRNPNRRILVGIQTRPGYIIRWKSYNVFAKTESKVPAGFKKKKMTQKEQSRYCGHKEIRNPANKIVSKSGKKYFIYDNYNYPYLVVIRGRELEVFSVSRTVHLPPDYLKTKTPKKYEYLYTNRVYSCTAQKIMIGRSRQNKMTIQSRAIAIAKGRGRWAKYDGNTILAQIAANKYVYIGYTVCEFTAAAEIVKYESPIGYSGIPYPVAIDSAGVFYLLGGDNVMVEVPKELLKKSNPAKTDVFEMYHSEDPKIRGKLKIKKIKMKNKIKK